MTYTFIYECRPVTYNIIYECRPMMYTIIYECKPMTYTIVYETGQYSLQKLSCYYQVMLLSPNDQSRVECLSVSCPESNRYRSRFGN